MTAFRRKMFVRHRGFVWSTTLLLAATFAAIIGESYTVGIAIFGILLLGAFEMITCWYAEIAVFPTLAVVSIALADGFAACTFIILAVLSMMALAACVSGSRIRIRRRQLAMAETTEYPHPLEGVLEVSTTARADGARVAT